MALEVEKARRKTKEEAHTGTPSSGNGMASRRPGASSFGVGRWWLMGGKRKETSRRVTSKTAAAVFSSILSV